MKDIIDNLLNGIKDEINSCILAKIVKFDSSKLLADVIPLTRAVDRTGKANQLSMLINVPVATLQAGNFIIRPPYKEGDIVVVVIADSDIEGTVITGDVSDPATTRKHSLDDGIIIGGFKALNSSLPEEYEDDLVIADNEFKTKIILKSDGSIEIEGSGIDIISKGTLNLEGSDVNIKGGTINLN